MSKDYRENQFRRNWWDEKVPYLGKLTRNDVSMIVLGIVLAALYFKFGPKSMDWVFGLRP